MLYGLFVVFAAGLFGAVPLGAYALSLAQRQEGIPLPLAVAFSGVLGVCCLVFFAVSLCCARPGWPCGGKGDRSLPLWGTLAGVLTGIQGLNTAWFAFSCDGLASKLSSLALGLLAAGAGCAFALGQWGKGPRLLAPVLIFPWLAFSLVSLFLPGGGLPFWEIISLALEKGSLLVFFALYFPSLSPSRPRRLRRVAAGAGLCTAFLGFSLFFPQALVSQSGRELALLAANRGQLLFFALFAYSGSLSILFPSSEETPTRPPAPDQPYYYHARGRR